MFQSNAMLKLNILIVSRDLHYLLANGRSSHPPTFGAHAKVFALQLGECSKNFTFVLAGQFITKCHNTHCTTLMSGDLES